MHTDAYASETERWKAVIERDPLADGRFVYAVLTTGIYCRPHCASRRPRRENVRFFDTGEQAKDAGFRPCRRCAPEADAAPNRAAEAVLRACALIENSERPPSLRELAATVGLSPAHFQRLFRKHLGVSPKQYALQKRLERVHETLRHDETITTAIHAAGFESGSRFYEGAEGALGMKPTQFRRGGDGTTISYAVSQTSLGLALVAVTDLGVCRIDLGDDVQTLVARLRDAFPKARLQGAAPELEGCITQALACLDEPTQAAALPLDIRGTAFQRQVWAALRSIPAGAKTTYTQIARQIGRPKAVRAVANACAANSIAVVVPCHRVLRGDGGLGGYRWGLHRKQALLERETGRNEGHDRGNEEK